MLVEYDSNPCFKIKTSYQQDQSTRSLIEQLGHRLNHITKQNDSFM